MTVEAVVKALVPGKWPRLLAGLTLVGAPSAFALPNVLPGAWLPPTELSLFLVRLLCSLLVFGAGCVATIIALIRHARSQSAALATAANRAAAAPVPSSQPYPSPDGPLKYPNLRIP